MGLKIFKNKRIIYFNHKHNKGEEKQMNRSTVFVGVLIAIFLASLIGVSIFFPLVTKDKATITVSDKQLMTKGGNGTYLVFTEEEIFKNSDCVMRGKWRSSDLQNKLKIGQTYDVDVYGWRIPLFSAYRNIVKITGTNGIALVR